MNEFNEFIDLSRYAGERYDLIQSAGGNTSVKLENGDILIKASGFLLSEICEEKGFAKLNNDSLISIFYNDNITKEKNKKKREELSTELVNKSVLGKFVKPSIETLLHSILLKFTLHTHPIAVLKIVIQKNWKEILDKIFDDDYLTINYHTPGVDLAISMFKKIKNREDVPKIIFLKNHGLIITSDNKDQVQQLNEYVLTKIENYLDINFDKYKLTNIFSKKINLLTNERKICYLSQSLDFEKLNLDLKSIELSFNFPDSFVYCGFEIVQISQISKLEPIEKYIHCYNESPKVIFYDKSFYIIANSLKKAKEIEELLNIHFITIQSLDLNNINSLDLEELKYLGSWDAEKFRQNI